MTDIRFLLSTNSGDLPCLLIITSSRGKSRGPPPRRLASGEMGIARALALTGLIWHPSSWASPYRKAVPTSPVTVYLCEPSTLANMLSLKVPKFA